jgi:hypothetical protein
MTETLDETIYRLDAYAPLVGTTFAVGPEGDVPVELVSATELSGTGTCFSLIFRAAAEAPLAQCTYRVGHPLLGEFPLFLVPLGPSEDDGRMELQAIVNRLGTER